MTTLGRNYTTQTRGNTRISKTCNKTPTTLVHYYARAEGALEYLTYRAWDLGEGDKEVQKFPLNRGDNKPRRCEQNF